MALVLKVVVSGGLVLSTTTIETLSPTTRDGRMKTGRDSPKRKETVMPTHRELPDMSIDEETVNVDAGINPIPICPQFFRFPEKREGFIYHLLYLDKEGEIGSVSFDRLLENFQIYPRALIGIMKRYPYRESPIGKCQPNSG